MVTERRLGRGPLDGVLGGDAARECDANPAHDGAVAGRALPLLVEAEVVGLPPNPQGVGRGPAGDVEFGQFRGLPLRRVELGRQLLQRLGHSAAFLGERAAGGDHRQHRGPAPAEQGFRVGGDALAGGELGPKDGAALSAGDGLGKLGCGASAGLQYRHGVGLGAGRVLPRRRLGDQSVKIAGRTLLCFASRAVSTSLSFIAKSVGVNVAIGHLRFLPAGPAVWFSSRRRRCGCRPRRRV